MSAQMIELLILAVIAFLIISKFLSILGTTDEDDQATKSNSFFGEPRALKDVTGTAPSNTNNVISIKKSITFSADEKTNAIVLKVIEKMPYFDPEKFLRNSQVAVGMIIEALNAKDENALVDLVDKRFITEIITLATNYKNLDPSKLDTSFKDSYSFGNSIYIKVSLTAPKFKESWVFTRNVTQSNPAWYLSNIEK